jgi:glycosyltransferase involved in cell wall biosynthesis
MRISGFSFGRNLIELDYPVVESVTSVLPLVDEFIFTLGDSNDATTEVVTAIPSDKLRWIHSAWNDSRREDGLIFSQQASLAFQQCKGDWAIFVNADEVIHEKDYDPIMKAIRRAHDRRDILGLMFRYYHFDGDYWSTNPWRYHKEIRVVRNDGRVEPCGDMSGFRCVQDKRYLKSGPKERWTDSGAYIYHYGWVRKNPRIMLERNKRLEYYYHDNSYIQENYGGKEEFDYEYYEALKEFRGEHPAVMKERISRATRLRKRRNRWLNPRFYKEVLRHGFKG